MPNSSADRGASGELLGMAALVIRNTCLADGTGAPQRTADVTVDGGVITSVESAAHPLDS